MHKAFQLYAKDLKPHGTAKDMVRYGLRFAGRSVVQGLSILDVDISQAHIRWKGQATVWALERLFLFPLTDGVFEQWLLGYRYW